MKTVQMLSEDTLYDKIYAGWMGKNIGGTLGGPLEGEMRLLDIHGYTQQFLEPVENDDLDLQLVALHCVEQNNGAFDASLLAREWLQHVHFEYDEYGHALTNMRKGLTPPLSGCFNNYFTDCMGSPIRSELWAMICAGDPDRAAWCAYQDAIVDHAGGEGMYGEIFFAVFESLAFVETDMMKLIHTALTYLPADCATRRAVEHLLHCREQALSWQAARQSLLDRFASSNFTYAPVNIALTLLGLLYAETFTERLLIAADSGYDTDCTCATIASMMGILYGSSYIDPCWTEPLGENIVVSRPVTGIDAPKTIRALTDRTLQARKKMLALWEGQECPEIHYETCVEHRSLPCGAPRRADVEFLIRWEDNTPTIAPNSTRQVFLSVRNRMQTEYSYSVSIALPEGFRAERQPPSQTASEKRTLLADEGREEAFLLYAPPAKSGCYRGNFLIASYFRGVVWSVDTVPFSLLPTCDWVMCTQNEKQLLHCNDNCIVLPNGEATIQLETQLQLDCAGVRKIKLSVSCPVQMWVDDQKVLSNTEKTDVIPAYHRGNEKEWTGLLSRGTHKIRILLTDAADADRCFFFVLWPEETWFASDLAYALGAEE